MAQDLFELQGILTLLTEQYDKAVEGALGKFKDLKGLVEKGLSLAIDVAWDFTKDVFSTGLETDKALAGVYAVTEATEQEAQDILRNAAIAEAAVSSLNVADMTMIEYYQGLAGIDDPTEIAKNIHGIAVAIEASGEDVKVVSDIITDIANAYNISTEHAADVLAAAATSANTTITQAGKALQYFGPLAAALGFSLEDSVIQLGLAANSGIKSGMAGRGMRNIITRTATNAGATANKLGALDIVTRKLGVDFYDTSGNVRDFNEYISDARKAWQGLNEEDRNTVLEQFGEIAREGADVDTVLKELNEDAALVQNLAQQAAGTKVLERAEEYENQIQEISSQYKDLYDLLDIPMPTTPTEYADALEQAQIKLGLLTDQQKVYYADQIAAKQGMSTWLVLMETSKDDADDLTESINNAAGAAERMRDIRLGTTLWGDITKFNAAWDAMLNTIYYDVNSPIRGIVQEATVWIQDITDAIGDNGLQGGIDMLATHLDMLADDEHVQALLESIGGMVGTVVGGMIDKVLPKVIDAIPGPLGALLRGFGGTVTDNVKSDSWEFTKILSGAATTLGGLLNTDNGIMGIFQNAFQIKPVANIKDIQAALDEANANGELYVTINDVQFPATLDAITIMDELIWGTESAVTNGAASGAVNMEGILDQTSKTAATNFETVIGAAGTPAGNAFGENFQTSLNNRTYSVQVDADVGGLPVQHNARAMTGGRIFKRPTIFGYAEGSYQVAGDAGPEAVVGVNSLYGMISQAVDNTMGQRMEYTEPLTTPEPTYYESTSGAVERVTNYGSDSASSAIANTVSAIYEVVQSIPRALETMAVADPTMNTLAAMNGVAQRILPALDSVTGAIDNAIFSNTEAVILSGDSVASTISGTITTYADMMMATMAEILTAVRICASKNNNASMEMDGVTFARVFLPYLNREQQRLGVNLSKGAAL